MLNRITASTLLLSLATLLIGCQKSGDPVVSPRPLAVSMPVPVNQVEDAAIWIHPDDPAKNLLLICNKTHGLEVHHGNGSLLKAYDDGAELAGVDVLYEFPVGDKKIDLVLAAAQTKTVTGVEVWRVDPSKVKLKPATADGMIRVFDGGDALGICAYHSRKNDKCYFFATSSLGQIEQHELLPAANDEFSAKRVRKFSLPGKVKAGVVDDERGVVYFAEEKVGIWRYPAEPDDESKPTLVIRAGEHGLIPDLTGITLYGAANGHGYLVIVSQGEKGGDSSFLVYQREEPNAFVLKIEPSAGQFGVPHRSSGIAVTNAPMPPEFPSGLLAAKCRFNPNGIEDYKLYSWKDIAQSSGLVIDTNWSPRPRKAMQARQ